MTYYLYHIPGKKIGVTRDLKERVENQQGYNEDEYTVLMESDDIQQISVAEISMQKAFGYPVDRVPYNKPKGVMYTTKPSLDGLIIMILILELEL